jgi:hypothetical protein
MSNLPPEPQRKDFKTEEAFLEALSGWRHRVGPILRLSKASPPNPPSREKMVEENRMGNLTPLPKREDFKTQNDYMDAVYDAASGLPIKKINADKFGYTEGDLQITAPEWTDTD